MKGSMGPGYPSYTIWGWGMCKFLVFMELEPFSTLLCPPRQRISSNSWKNKNKHKYCACTVLTPWIGLLCFPLE